VATALRVVVLASVMWLAVHILLIGRRIRKGAVGRPPISRPAFILAKICLIVPFVLLLWKAAARPPHLATFAAVLVLCLLAVGTVIFALGLFKLGANLRMGLPQEETVLITSGIYRFSRNPIYLGAFVIMAASLVYAFSWANLVATAIAVILHHRITLAEEKYLAGRFREFASYRNRVRRYC
jgi:protein-S-isoprenylcysteine O-methyltransferase Ste14